MVRALPVLLLALAGTETLAAPRFVARQDAKKAFLALGLRADSGRASQIVKPCEEACAKAGEAGEESSCFTMCEAEMYKCHDHNHTVATAEFQTCHDEVVAKYEKYHAELLQTKQIVKPCEEACFKAGEAGDESSCFTMCESEMYKCHDHNHTVATEEFQKCHDEVVAKYEKYHAELLQRQIVKPCEGACFKAGEAGEESSCFTMCESEMYKCHDHNHTVATEEFQKCHDEVVAKYEKYHAELLQKRQIVKPCEDACVKAGEAGEDSSCYTMCESEMYKCHDHNHTVATVEFQKCHDEVVAKYETYHAELLQKSRQIVKPCEEACFKAGEPGDESSCFTMCESEMYKCHDHNHTVATAEFQKCHDEVVAKYEKYHAELLQTEQIVKPCEDACVKAGEPGEESSCFTMCESEMYKCHDHNHTVATAEFQKCHDEVVAKYEKYHAELLLASKGTSQNSTHMQAQRGESTFDRTRQIVKPCEEACFKAGEAGEESSCFTMCEAEMYKCHDHNHTVAVEEFKLCHDEVVAKYEKYHAELFFVARAASVNRTSSKVTADKSQKVNRTQQIVRPCEDACFKADKDSNQQCQTECEAEMYRCHDYNHTVATDDFKACHDKVVATYENYGK